MLTDEDRREIRRKVRRWHTTGEELVITAKGPDAHKTLGACRVLLEVRPEDRRGVYRRLRKGA